MSTHVLIFYTLQYNYRTARHLCSLQWRWVDIPRILVNRYHLHHLLIKYITR